MDLDYTADDLRFREEAREWLHANTPRELPPEEGRAGRREFDLAWQRTQYEGGWAGISWPKEYGGRGLSLVQQLIWYEEYANAGAPPSGMCFVGLNHAGPTLIARGSEAQKKAHLAAILRGDVVWCQGFSEPGSGSDLGSLRTKAEIDGDHLVITGQKIWTSHAHFADFQELLVRTGRGPAKHDGISWVICDMRTPGIEVRPITILSEVQHFCEVFYNEVRIPLSNVVGEVNAGWNVAMATLSFERGTGFIAHQMEMAESLRRLRALAETLPGPDGNRPLAADDEVVRRFGQLRAEVMAMRAMAYATVSRAARTGKPGPEGSMMRLYYGELLQRIKRFGMELRGMGGLVLGDAADDWTRQYLTSFKTTISAGTAQIQRNIIGERVLGLPRCKRL